MEDQQPVWKPNSDYWPYSFITKFLSKGPTLAINLFNKRSKTYMSRTGKTYGGTMGGGKKWRMRMGKRIVGSNESMKNLMMRMENISNISRIWKKDGQKKFMIRMGKREGFNRIMKRESNWERMTKRDGGSWGRTL